MTGNRLLDALPEDTWQRLCPDLASVAMPAGQVLHGPGLAMENAYFPATAIVSKFYLMADGSSSGVALVGPEGMVGLSLILGGESSPDQAQVLRGGHGWRVPARALHEEFERGAALAKLLLAYTHSLLSQTMETAACNSRGTLQQRFCRWLLMNLDRTSTSEVKMTHQAIADVLGVRRESVSEAAGALQDRGLIRYRWGLITVVDRHGLERLACSCYSAPARARTPAAVPLPAPGWRRADCAAPFGGVAA
jgi:CRP-like cAMP-binding protein